MSLYPWQIPTAKALTGVLNKYPVALDASETGTGKTYVALEVMRQGGLVPLVVCPKAAIPTWRRVSEELGAPVQDVLNPEKLKTAKYPYLKKGGRKNEWIWTSKTNAVIFDECHRFSGIKTQNAWVMAALKLYGLPALCLSATAAESPLKLRALGFLLGLHNWRDFWSWARQHGCYTNPWGGVEFTADARRRDAVLRVLHSQIFPEHGVRVKIDDIEGFPDNEVIAEAYELSDRATKNTQRAYDEAADEPEETNPLVKLLRACQKAELQKVDFLVDCVEDTLAENRSPVIFTRFRETQALLLDQCRTKFGDTVAVINGDQNAEDREAAIQRFQANHAHVMLAMIQAGGVAVSLHDLKGRPRSSFICPTYNAVELKQALGRIHRAGALSKAVQKIVFAAGTVEEKVCKKVKQKLENIDLLNDGDLQEGVVWK